MKSTTRPWLDAVAQRQIALVVFCCIGFFKLAAVLNLILMAGTEEDEDQQSPFPFSHWVEWSLLDAVFFVALKICKVPRMNFSWSLTLLMAVSLALINGGVLGGISSVVTSSLFPLTLPLYLVVTSSLSIFISLSLYCFSPLSFFSL